MFHESQQSQLFQVCRLLLVFFDRGRVCLLSQGLHNVCPLKSSIQRVSYERSHGELRWGMFPTVKSLLLAEACIPWTLLSSTPDQQRERYCAYSSTADNVKQRSEYLT